VAGRTCPRLYGYSDINVKIVPSNQALLEQASRLVTGSADLKRVTILSARPDSTVVVQADYFSANDGYSRDDVSAGDEIPSAASRLPAIQTVSANPLHVVNSGLRTRSEPTTTSYNLKPTQLYARTQRGFEDTATSVLDVLA
jgi:hypothetical protein